MQTYVRRLKKQCTLVNVEQFALLCNSVGAHWFLRTSLLLTQSATVYNDGIHCGTRFIAFVYE